MPTSYTSLLGLALPVQGELAGSWGNTVNDYITQYVDEAVAGAQTISGSQTAVTLSTTTGVALTQAGSSATGSAQYAIINCTGNPAGLLTITAPAKNKVYLVLNNTSTAQNVKVVAAGPTTGVTVAAAHCALIAWNGSDFELVATTDASKLTGVLAVANGGTGLSSLTANNVLIGNGTSAVQFVAPSTSGNLLTSNGTTWTSAAPAIVSLTTGVTGTLPVGNGGTGATTLTGYVRGNGTSAFTASATVAGSDVSGNISGNAANVTGTVAVANGGTGLTTFPALSLPVANTLDIVSALTAAAGQSIRINAGGTAWEAYTPTSGTGNVTGPGSSTDNAIVRFDGTSGQVLQNSAATIADTTGDITAGKYNKVTITAPATGSTLTIADGKTLTANNSLTLSGTDATTMTFPSTSQSIAGLGVAQTFTAAQTFRAASSVRAEAASTQDAVVLAGRAGGTSSFAVTLTPTTLGASRTLTLPDNSGTVLTTGATVTVAQGGTGATTLTGVLKGNGTSAFTAATANTDYLVPALANTAVTGFKTATFNSQTTIATTTGSITVDWTAAQNQLQTEPTGTITYTFTAPPGPCHLQLLINSDGTSTAQTINWPGTVIQYGATWAGVNNKRAVINFWYDGTNYHMIGTNQV